MKSAQCFKLFEYCMWKKYFTYTVHLHYQTIYRIPTLTSKPCLQDLNAFKQVKYIKDQTAVVTQKGCLHVHGDTDHWENHCGDRKG